MANSDNVLRGGLTPKHIDVPELLKHIRFEETNPRVILAEGGEQAIPVFATPAPDFELSRIQLLKGDGIGIAARSIEIYMVLEGQLSVEESPATHFDCHKGEAFLAFDRAGLGLTAKEDTIVYRAAVPMRK
jgi:mannose-6-phosphate isomerase